MSGTTAVLDRPGAATPRVSGHGLVLGIGVVLLAAHIPTLFAHFQAMWMRPHYQLFPLLIAGAFFLLWPIATYSYSMAGALRPALAVLGAGAALVALGWIAEAMEIIAIGSSTAWIAAGGVVMFTSLPILIFAGTGPSLASQPDPATGMTIAVVDAVLLAVVVFFGSPIGGAFSALILLAALSFTLGGRSLFRRCAPALVLLLLVVGPPAGIDTIIVQKLQVVAAKMSSKLLDAMRVWHTLNGVTFAIGKRSYGIEQACSGIDSLVSITACVLFYCLYYRVHWLRTSFLLGFGLFWAVVNNIARIVGVIFFDNISWRVNLLTGLPHFLFGVVLFTLTLLLLFSTDRLLMFFGRSEPNRRRFEPLAQLPSAAAVDEGYHLAGAFYRSGAVAAVFGLFVVAQAAEMTLALQKAPYSGAALAAMYQPITVAALPESYGNWKRPEAIVDEKRSSGDPLGEYSKEWRYKNEGSQLVFSFDFPYPQFHDVRFCYRGIGWTDEQTDVSPCSIGDGRPDLKFVRVRMSKSFEQYGYLWFCQFDQDGMPIEPEDLFPISWSEKLSSRVAFQASRWQRLLQPGRAEKMASGYGSVLQVQMLFVHSKPLTDGEIDQFQSFFTDALKRLRAQSVNLKSARK